MSTGIMQPGNFCTLFLALFWYSVRKMLFKALFKNETNTGDQFWSDRKNLQFNSFGEKKNSKSLNKWFDCVISIVIILFKCNHNYVILYIYNM